MLEQWMLTMIILHTLFYPELTDSSVVCEDENICGCLKKENMQIKRVYENTMAIIPCPNLEENEELISVSLLKGKTKLHSTDMRNKSQELWGRFKVSVQNYSVSYMIQGTESNDTGIYICIIQTQSRTTEENVILLVKDAQQSTESTEASVPCPSPPTLPIVIGAIVLYDVLITLVCCVLRYKVKNKEPPENPYMNTRPARFRRR